MNDDKRTLEELEERQGQVVARLKEIDAEHAGAYIDPRSDDGREWDELAKERDKLQKAITQGHQRKEYLSGLAEDPANREAGAEFNVRPAAARGEDIYDLSTVRASLASPDRTRTELHDRARRSIAAATFPHERADAARSREHLEALLSRADNDDGAVARHILATGSPIYKRAFGKTLQGKPLSDPEMRALSSVSAEGGYAVPYELDPTLIPTSNLSVNPYRAISRVETTVSNEWRGVTAGRITASYGPEKTEASDNSPTLGQPVLNPEKAQAFIPFTIEIGQDWGALQAEMARLLQDAKDDLEAVKFTKGSGHGSEEPQGIITGGTAVVSTAGTAAFAVGDLYALEEALPPRFRPMAQFVANRSIYNKVRQFDTDGGAALWMRLAQGLANQVPTPGNTGARLLDYPANEASEYDDAVTGNKLILTLGDFRRGFLIVDRIGMAVEVVPHLFGTANGYPTGERGLYAHWRNTSQVIVPNAFRTLKVLA